MWGSGIKYRSEIWDKIWIGIWDKIWIRIWDEIWIGIWDKIWIRIWWIGSGIKYGLIHFHPRKSRV
jgi:hypothetical protein